MIHKKIYKVYVLVKDGKAVYVGCTTNINTRKSQHRKDKDFDTLRVIKSCNDKKTAYAIENALITFLTLFGDGEWYNAENIIHSFDKLSLRGKY